MNVLLIGDITFHQKVVAQMVSQENVSKDKNNLCLEAHYVNSVAEALPVIEEVMDVLGVIVLGVGIVPEEGKRLFLKIREQGDSIPPVLIWASTLSHEEVCGLNFYASNLFNKYLYINDKNFEGLLVDAISATMEELKRENLIKYSKVSIERMLEHNYVNCDVYLRLSEIKLIRIIKKNELYSHDIIEKYLNRGVKHLYVKSEEYMSFTEFVFKTLKSKFTNTGGESLSGQLNLSIGGTQLVQEALACLKVDEDTTKILTEVTAASMNILKGKAEVKKILEEVASRSGYLHIHSVLISYISGLMALKMQWSSTATLQKLGMAAIIHDVTLDSEELARVNNLHGLDYQKISWAEVEKIKKHPQLAVQLLDKLDDLPPDVSSIILTHHETPEGDGFPRGLVADKITQINCLFIIAEDFVNHIFNKKVKSEVVMSVASKFKKKYGIGNYRKPVEGFLKVLEESF